MKMDTECTQCGKLYKINVSGIESQFVKYSCQACQTENVIENPRFASGEILDFDDDDHLDYDDEEMDEYPGDDEPRRAAQPDDEDSSLLQKLILMANSIRTRIIAVLVLLIAISLSVVGWVASSRSHAALADQAQTSLKLYAEQKAREYALSFDRIQQEVEAMANYTRELYESDRVPSELEYREHVLMPWNGKSYGGPQYERELRQEILTTQQLVPFIINIVRKNPYASLGYLGTETRLMVLDAPAAVESIGGLVGYENTKRPWYIKAKTEGKTIWTEPYVDADTKELIVTCGAPVRAAGRFVGVAAYDVALATIQKDILTLDIGYNSYAFLVGKNGKALVRPGMNKGDTRWDKTYETDDLLNTSNRAYNAIVANMVAGQRGVETYMSEEGENYVAYAPLPAIGASVAIVASKDKVVSPAKAIQSLITFVWLMVLALAIVAGFYIGNGIAKPINELTNAADRISQGEMDLEMLTEDRKDEIGRLTKSFNRLVTSLKIALSVR